MEINTAINLINTVGFPIFVCLILIWFIRSTLIKLTDSNIKLSESMNENTQAIKILIAQLGVKKNV